MYLSLCILSLIYLISLPYKAHQGVTPLHCDIFIRRCTHGHCSLFYISPSKMWYICLVAKKINVISRSQWVLELSARDTQGKTGPIKCKALLLLIFSWNWYVSCSKKKKSIYSSVFFLLP